MDFVPDSDDEGPSLHLEYTTNRLSHPKEPGNAIYSDEEDHFRSQATHALVLQAATAATEDETPKRLLSLGKSTLTARRPRPPFGAAGGRRLVSSAVEARQAVQSAQKEEPQHKENDDVWSLDPSPSTLPSAQPLFPPRVDPSPPTALPVPTSNTFLGRLPPQPLKPLPQLPPKQDTQPTRKGASSSARPQSQPGPLLNGPGLASHTGNDGVNIVIRKRTRDESDQALPASKSKPSVNKGWGNNFMRIDMKKGRGSTKFRPSKRSTSYRRQGRGRWKTPRLRQVGDGADFLEGWESRSSMVCFRCNGKGHWAKDCPEAAAGMLEDTDDGDAPLNADGDADADDEENIVGVSNDVDAHEIIPSETTEGGRGEALAAVDVEALCDPNKLQENLGQYFGFDSFRGLQLSTIQQVLRGVSCLSIMPTGMGKSLCYQLPALLLPGVTIVISPLIALMHDQCRAAPKELRPAVLWSGQTQAEARQILKEVENGTVRLLFVSPERMGNPHLLAALRPHMPLPLVVVDEAHCVAEWGHSFRPAYFRLGEVLQRDVQSRCVLALTATATKATEAAVCDVLRIPETQVLRDSAIRDNLRLHVVRSRGTPTACAGTGIISSGWEQVVSLFRSKGPLSNSRSAIVYCAWKSDADALASALVSSGVNAKAYHAGRSLQDRSNIEKAFGIGRLRVVVATVAFGMGIDISSVDAVVHATMPRSLEEYVQQIGRAGRDGSQGRCFAHLSDQDFISLRSLAYSGMVSRDAIATVLSKIFSQDYDKKNKNYGALDCKKLAAEVDMQEDSIEALLGYLEADERPFLRVLPAVALTTKVSFYASTPEDMMDEYPIVKAVVASCPRPRNGLHTAPTAKLAVAAQKPPGAVLQDLQAMAQRKLIGFEQPWEKGPAFEVLRFPRDLNELATTLHARLSFTLRCQVARLDTSYRSLNAAASQNNPEKQEQALREALEEYFSRQEQGTATEQKEDPCAALDLDGLPLRVCDEKVLLAAKTTLRRNMEQGGPAMCAQVLARVLHGTGTAAVPRSVWSKQLPHFWGKLKDVDFAHVHKACAMACNSVTNDK